MKLVLLLGFLSNALFAGNDSLVGTVRLADGQALPGASVYVTQGLHTFVTVSDLDGNYRIELEEGAYTVQAWSGNLKSNPGAITIKAGTEWVQNLELATDVSEIPVSLKISPLNRAGAAKSIQLKFAAGPAVWPPLESASLQSALAEFADGEYEVVVSRPGAVFVGTCLILSGLDGAKRLVQADGLEISGEDYVQALALQDPTVIGLLKGR